MEPTDQHRWIAEVRAEWHELWERRLEDEERAEGIADRDYSLLSVEKGLVIFATRACRPPRLEEILGKHGLHHVGVVAPPPSVGGWRKFARATYRRRTPLGPSAVKVVRDRQRLGLQAKKGGRGWLHAL